MAELTHSHSSITQFEQCPKRYFHQRITKEVKDVGSAASVYGERVHKQLEDRLKHGTPLPTDTAMHEGIISAVANSKRYTMHAEQEYTLTKELKPTTWWAEDAWLRSKLDVLGIGETSACVIDWKTGKRKKDFDQLELFAVQTFLHNPDIMRVESAFVWLSVGAVDTETYQREELPALLLKLLSRIKRIERAKETGVWPAKPSGLCPYCPAKDICEFAQQGRRR